MNLLAYNKHWNIDKGIDFYEYFLLSDFTCSDR